jgi:hypothetical protein
MNTFHCLQKHSSECPRSAHSCSSPHLLYIYIYIYLQPRRPRGFYNLFVTRKKQYTFNFFLQAGGRQLLMQSSSHQSRIAVHLPPTHPPITIATQNVGGIRGEFKLKKGPKLSMIRKLITSATDFLVLTEIIADQQAIMNKKLKYNLQPFHFSPSQHAARGCVDMCQP